jgi:hypothetical protein
LSREWDKFNSNCFRDPVSLGKKRVLESSITRATGAVWFHAKWLHAFKLQNYSLTWIFLNAIWPEENTCHCWVVLFRVTLQRLGHCSSSLSFPVLLTHWSIWNLSVYHVISESWSNPGNCQETHLDKICVVVNKPILLRQSWKWETPRLEFSLWQRRWACLIFVPPLLLLLNHCSNDSTPTEK